MVCLFFFCLGWAVDAFAGFGFLLMFAGLGVGCFVFGMDVCVLGLGACVCGLLWVCLGACFCFGLGYGGVCFGFGLNCDGCI